MNTLLNDKIDIFIMDAMKNHNEVRTRTLRLIKTAFMEARTAKGAQPLDEAKEIQILQKMVKQREDARQMYIDANRLELAKNEFEEMEIIKEFLPKPVSREEIQDWLTKWTLLQSNTELYSKKNMGYVIKTVKEHFPGADGKLVAEVVKENLV